MSHVTPQYERLTAGAEAMHEPDAPAAGWYLLWVDEKGREHRHGAFLEGNLSNQLDRPCQICEHERSPLHHIVGIYHDDYFPPQQA